MSRIGLRSTLRRDVRQSRFWAESGHDDNGRLVRSAAMRDYSILALQLRETFRNFTAGVLFFQFLAYFTKNPEE
jgi:hypothetical protein